MKISRPVSSERARPRPISSLIHSLLADPAHRTSPLRNRWLLTLLFVALVGCFAAATPGSTAAQSFSGFGDVDATGTSYHRFVRPGEATVEVLLLGNTGQSGIYVVGFDTDLAEFLALSGITFGSTSGRDITKVTVQLYRQQGATRQMVFEAPVEDVIVAAANVPVFNDGDIIYVETRSRTRITWFDFVRSASSIATLVFVAERLVNAIR